MTNMLEMQDGILEKTFPQEVDLSDETIRYEQIGNIIYLMAVPSRFHEAIITKMIKQFDVYLEDKSCEVYGSNLGLDLKEFIPILKNYESFWKYFNWKDEKEKYKGEEAFLLPDVSVICDEDDNNFGPHGYKKVPKMLVEVYSPSTGTRDMTLKKDIYELIGVPEYWVIQDNRNVSVFLLRNGKYEMVEYQAKGEDSILEVPVSIFSDLKIVFKNKFNR